MKTILIDADSLVYEAAKANEFECNWGDDQWTLHANLEPAQAQLDASVSALVEKLGADKVVMALSDYTDPWRKRIMPTYKANRKDVRKPVIFQPLREYVHKTYTTYQRPGLEGDDVLGILLTAPGLFPGEKVCVSLDKDMKTLPGMHYNMQKQVEFFCSVDDADLWHLTQAITGDTVDGYPGCPGIGPKTAEKLLAPFIENDPKWISFDRAGAWKAIVEAYAKKGLSEEVALMNARVARICRHEDFDYDKKEVRLWTPAS